MYWYEVFKLFPVFNDDDEELKRQTEIIERLNYQSGHKQTLRKGIWKWLR